VVSVLTGAIKMMADDVRKLTDAVQSKAKDATDVEAHIQKVGKGVAAVGTAATAAASAAANDARKGAEAGLSKGLDTAKNAADLNAHASIVVQAAGGRREKAQGARMGASMHMSAPRIHVIGNSVCDVMVKGGANGKGKAIDSFSGDNVEMIAEPITPVLGGSGAASAYVLGKLGAHTRLHTNIADDAFGAMLCGWLKEAGVTLASPPSAATATHVIYTQGAKRKSTYYRGEKVRWKDAMADLSKWEEGDWCLVAGYGAVDADDLADIAELVAAVQQRSCLVAFDPSPWFAGKVDKQDMLALWKQLDVLSGTEDELRQWVASKTRKLESLERKLFDKAKSPGKAKAPDPDSPSAASSSNKAGGAENQGSEALAKECLELCSRARLVVVKRGAQGASWAAPLLLHNASTRSSVECGSVAARACEASSSVGAGDTFNAQLIFGLASGLTPSAAVEAAVARASRAVAHGSGAMGAMTDAGSGGASSSEEGLDLETSLS